MSALLTEKAHRDRLFDRRQGFVDPVNQIGKAEWLGDVIVCPTLKSGEDVFLLALGGKHYHWNAAGTLIIFQFPEYFNSAHHRHHYVQYNEVRTV